jgi:hypothetical protein
MVAFSYSDCLHDGFPGQLFASRALTEGKICLRIKYLQTGPGDRSFFVQLPLDQSDANRLRRIKDEVFAFSCFGISPSLRNAGRVKSESPRVR